MKIAITTAIEQEPYAIDHLGVKQGLDWMGWDYLIADPIIRGAEDAISRIIKFKPDIVVHYMDIMLKSKAPEIIAKAIKTKQVFWEMDYRPMAHNTENSYDGQWNHWLTQAPYLDHIFLSNKGQIDWWEKEWKTPVSYLPHGCYIPDKPKYDPRFVCGCVFIGSMINSEPFVQRTKLIEKIRKYIQIAHINSHNPEERNENWKNMPAIYHSADTILDISHFWDNPGYASGRYFYSAGLGGCSITKQFPDCKQLYPDGTKVYFNTPEEAIEKIKYYQKHSRARNIVKQKAFEHTKKYHNFKLRFQKIYDTLTKS